MFISMKTFFPYIYLVIPLSRMNQKLIIEMFILAKNGCIKDLPIFFPNSWFWQNCNDCGNMCIWGNIGAFSVFISHKDQVISQFLELKNHFISTAAKWKCSISI